MARRTPLWDKFAAATQGREDLRVKLAEVTAERDRLAAELAATRVEVSEWDVVRQVAEESLVALEMERARAAKLEAELAAIREHYGFAMARQDANDIPVCEECGCMRVRPLAGYVAPEGSPDGHFCPNCGEQAVRAPVVAEDCRKDPHVGTGYLHDESDDRPFDVDGVEYCGRCHGLDCQRMRRRRAARGGQ